MYMYMYMYYIYIYIYTHMLRAPARAGSLVARHKFNIQTFTM